MDLPAEVQRRIASDHVAWLTTVADSGTPAPNPVWVVLDGDDLLVFTTPDARKVRNIERRPRVSLHFSSQPNGADLVVITGEATATPDRAPSAVAAYRDKYEATITGPMGMTVAEVDATYNVELRIHPTHVRLAPT